jgi:hypothetical protein
MFNRIIIISTSSAFVNQSVEKNLGAGWEFNPGDLGMSQTSNNVALQALTALIIMSALSAFVNSYG